MKDLKNYREKELPLYIISNILIFLVVHQFIQIYTSDLYGSVELLSQIFASIVLSVIAFGLIFVIECLFTDELKRKLLYLFSFFGKLNPPGYTIFSKIRDKDNDYRFTHKSLQEKYPLIYKNLPTNKKEQLRYENKEWYTIYNKIREVPMIHVSQRDYLLCRDIYISTLVILLLYTVVSALKLVNFNSHYLIFLIITSAITNIGANRKAKRFVYNVIAYDLSKPQEGGK